MSEETQTEAAAATAATEATAVADGASGVDTTAGADGASTAQETATAAQRPDWLPEKFYDPESGAPRLEELAKSYAELESARLERAKKAPDDYHLPKAFEGFEKQLPPQHVAALKELAKSEGYSQKGFELLMQGTFGDPAAGRAALEAEFGDQLNDTLAACATFANTLGDHKQAVSVLTSFPEGVKLLNAWRMASADKPLPGQPGEGVTGKTADELATMMRDPRYSDPHKRDPAFVESVNEGFKKLYSKQVRTAGANAGEFSGPGQLA